MRFGLPALIGARELILNTNYIQPDCPYLPRAPHGLRLLAHVFGARALPIVRAVASVSPYGGRGLALVRTFPVVAAVLVAAATYAPGGMRCVLA
jgi:hypothetical protein